VGGQAYGGMHTCMRIEKVPCTAAAAGAPWTSFVAAVNEVARTPPGWIAGGYYPDTVFPDRYFPCR